MEIGIFSVVGKDSVGIIAKVCTYLAEHDVNILDISQTILDGYFNMMMIVDATHASAPFNTLTEEMKNLGDDIGVRIKLQHENIFDKMHRL